MVNEQRGRAVDIVYAQLKAMAMSYKFRPGELLNEVELARQLDVSRTPLREALNRLASEGFLRSTPNYGYYSRELDPIELFELYDFRASLEVAIVGIVCERASDEELTDLDKFLVKPEAGLEANEMLARDEAFHLKLAMLTHNNEFLAHLERINNRIHFARWVDYKVRAQSSNEHKGIVAALQRRQKEQAMLLMGDHIRRRYDQIVEVVRQAIAEIHLSRSDYPR